MNKPDVHKLLERLFRVTGFRISIHDGSGREIAAYPEKFHAFCQVLQENPMARCRCKESDDTAFERAAKNGTLSVYRCPFGLYEAVYPLYRYGTLAGFLMMGQVAKSGGGVEEAFALAKDFADEKALEKALAKLPVYTQDKVEVFSELLTVFAEYMTLSGAVHAPSGDILSEVQKYLVENFSQPITVASLCAKFALSRTSLLYRYRERYGETVITTLIKIRMTEAQRLLSDTKLSVSEIAARCGYSDPNYFAKAYRKQFGISPGKQRAGEE